MARKIVGEEGLFSIPFPRQERQQFMVPINFADYKVVPDASYVQPYEEDVDYEPDPLVAYRMPPAREELRAYNPSYYERNQARKEPERTSYDAWLEMQQMKTDSIHDAQNQQRLERMDQMAGFAIDPWTSAAEAYAPGDTGLAKLADRADLVTQLATGGALAYEMGKFGVKLLKDQAHKETKQELAKRLARELAEKEAMRKRKYTLDDIKPPPKKAEVNPVKLMKIDENAPLLDSPKWKAKKEAQEKMEWVKAEREKLAKLEERVRLAEARLKQRQLEKAQDEIPLRPYTPKKPKQ